MKIPDIKKKFMRNFAIWGIAIVVAGALVFGIGQYHASSEDAKKQLDMQVQAARNQAVQMQNKANRIRSGMSFYETITGNAKSTQGVNRTFADETLKALNDELMLSKLSAKISPVIEATEVSLQTQGISVVKSDIELTMEGVSDELLLNFISQIKWRFPGYVRIHALTLKRIVLPEDDTYAAITSSAELPALAQGAVTLQWLGLRKTENAAAQGAAPAGGQPPAPSGAPGVVSPGGVPGMPGRPSMPGVTP